MDIKVFFRKSKLIKKIYFFSLKLKSNRQNICLEKEKQFRKNGGCDKRYLQLQRLKNLYLGKRCFIVATGPSLLKSDLELLKDEICLSMNSICKLYDKTSWRPTFYGIQDRLVFNKLKDVAEKYVDLYKAYFITDEIFTLSSKDVISRNNIVRFPYNNDYHFYDQQFNKFYSKFSDNAYGIVYDGYSITYSLLQIAVYMGFKEIYLLGCDCNYQKGSKNHIVESGHVDKYEYQNHDKMMTGYIEAKKYADAHGIKIINCTRGGMLEVFPRIALEDVLLNNK